MFVAVTEQGTYLKKDGERIVVEKNGERRQILHLQDITGIQLFGNIQVSTPLLQLLMQKGIAVHYLSRNGFFYGKTFGQQTSHYAVKMAQLYALTNDALQLALAQLTVQFKIHAQIANLSVRRHQVDTALVKQTCQKLEQLKQQCQQTTFQELLGIEGVSARLYFKRLDAILPSSLPFEKRTKQPAHNEMNSLLNYSYGLLKSEVLFALETTGLDVYLGFLHQPRHLRMSLVFDVMELFRPFVDAQLVLWVRQRQIMTKHFEQTVEGIYLTDEGRKHVITLWYQWKEQQEVAQSMRTVVEGLKTAYVTKEVASYEYAIKKALSHLL